MSKQQKPKTAEKKSFKVRILTANFRGPEAQMMLEADDPAADLAQWIYAQKYIEMPHGREGQFFIVPPAVIGFEIHE